MKKLLFLVAAILLLWRLPIAYADTTVFTDTYTGTKTVKSTGITVTPTGVRVTYILDNQSYGIAVGTPIYSYGKLHIDPELIVRPSDNSQLALGLALGYDYQPWPYLPLRLTPQVGILTDITGGYGGHQTLPFVGASLSIGF